MLATKKNILWDWNGTLLDDIEICIKGINILLANRKKPLVDKKHYRTIFNFPVRDYYKKAGFDFEKEPFEIPAEQFIVHYKEMLPLANLFPDAAETLLHFNQLYYCQYVVSAMEQTALADSIEKRGISKFFKGICGISNNLAFSKVENARKLLNKQKLNPDETILIGDTLHDAEVAKEIGIEVILVARGHQSEERLKKTGIPIIHSLCQLKEML